MKLLSLLIPLLCVACATGPRDLPAPPPKARPVAPEVSAVRESIAKTNKSVAIIDAGAKEAAREATKARQEAERLKNQQTASAAELRGLWESLQSVEARNLFLESETSRLSLQVGKLEASGAVLEQAAAEKDAEADELRRQLLFAADVIATNKKATADAEKAATKERTRADNLAGEIGIYRWLLWPVGIVLVLLVIAWIALKWFLPPSATDAILNRALSLNR